MTWLLLLLPLAIVLFMTLRAPDGWEDEDGFHYGKEDDES